jgi:hypothetical protein
MEQEEFEIEIPSDLIRLKKELDELVEKEAEARTRWTVKKNEVLMVALKQYMTRRLEKEQDKNYETIKFLKSVSGTRDNLVLCFNTTNKNTNVLSQTVVILSADTVLMNGIPDTSSFKRDWIIVSKMLVDKGLYEVYRTLEKKVDEIKDEPSAKRSKLGIRNN